MALSVMTGTAHVEKTAMPNLFKLIVLLPIILLTSIAATAAAKDDPQHQVATFAGGCFWCMEPPFDKLDGVISTTSGYTGGKLANPSYKQVSAGKTGHTEAVQVVFDPARISYAELLDVFWKNIDPLASNRQFCDIGSQYRSGIFFHDEKQRQLAEASRQQIASRFSQPVVTEITALESFYPAEEYHQDYYLKNPLRYKYYRYGCGRDQRLQALWGTVGKED
jgi:peptide-methionine (S)-S-oxide reductase